jgi:hypothetical protein
MTPRLRVRRRQQEKRDARQAREALDAQAEVIDLRDATAAFIPDDAQEARIAAWASRLDRERTRKQAEQELDALRQRHWSGERVLEEARSGLEWWELPDADPYAVLGILPGASLTDAAAARRDIARHCHPDLGPGTGTAGDEAARRMRAANAAYARLRKLLELG